MVCGRTDVEKRPKIVQVSHAFPPAAGGLETHVREISVALAQAGAEVAVHTSNAPGAADSDAKLSAIGVKVKRHFSIKLPFFSSAVLIPCIPPMLALENADAYCAHGFGSPLPFFASIGAALAGKPFFWTIHGVPKFKGNAKYALAAYRLLVAPLPLLLAKKIICVSDGVAKEMSAFASPEKITVIPNGISENFSYGEAPLHPPAKIFTVLYAGRLDRSKGVRLLAESFRDFHAAHPQSRLLFVGPDEGEKAWLEAHAKQNSLPVEFRIANQGEMPEVYASASVTVLPSEYEGFGLTVLESWACGTPAISTPVGAAPEFFEKAFGKKDALALLFTDKNSLTACLARIKSSTAAQRHTWAKNAKAALSDYSWAAIGRRTLLLIAPSSAQKNPSTSL